MTLKDYYRTLGVSPLASPDEIRTAFRNLAFKNHPDRNNGSLESEKTFKKINEAYKVLSDPVVKARYDGLYHASELTHVTNNSHSLSQQRNQNEWGNTETDNPYNTNTRKGFYGINPMALMISFALFVAGVCAFCGILSNSTNVLPVELKCSFQDCPSASWDKILSTISDQIGSNGISGISANMPNGSPSNGSGPAFMVIRVTYYDPQGKIDQISFYDSNLEMISGPEHPFSNKQSNAARSSSIRNIKITPREASQITWELAQSKIPKINGVYISLMFGDRARKKFGVESVWQVYYRDKLVKNCPGFYINAKTGKILLTVANGCS